MPSLVHDIERVLQDHKYNATEQSELADWFDKWAPRRTANELRAALMAVVARVEAED